MEWYYHYVKMGLMEDVYGYFQDDYPFWVFTSHNNIWLKQNNPVN
jgi:hypothetical protein